MPKSSGPILSVRTTCNPDWNAIAHPSSENATGPNSLVQSVCFGHLCQSTLHVNMHFSLSVFYHPKMTYFQYSLFFYQIRVSLSTENSRILI